MTTCVQIYAKKELEGQVFGMPTFVPDYFQPTNEIHVQPISCGGCSLRLLTLKLAEQERRFSTFTE